MIATPNSLIATMVPNTRINPLVRDVGMVVVGVALLAISAQFKVPLGPVPVTLQALVVMLIGGVYGWRMGGLTVAAYVLQGAALGGIAPAMLWFATPNFPGYAFVGATTGYLWGFVVAAAAIGFMSDTLRMRDNLITLFIAMMVGNVIITALGLTFAMAVYYPILQQTGQSFSTVWGWFAQPFIIGDTLKAVIATGLVFAGSAFVNRIRG